MAESREEKELLPLLDIGRCELHLIHKSFKRWAKKGSDWELQKLLKVMWKFLLEAPTRRSLYKNASGSLNYPLQFCGHRWCEYEKSAERAEMILEGYRKFITHTCSLKKSQQPDGKKSMIHDPLLPAKLKFFKMVPSKLNSFLRGFQPNLSPWSLLLLTPLEIWFVVLWKNYFKRCSQKEIESVQFDTNKFLG